MSSYSAIESLSGRLGRLEGRLEMQQEIQNNVMDLLKMAAPLVAGYFGNTEVVNAINNLGWARDGHESQIGELVAELRGLQSRLDKHEAHHAAARPTHPDEKTAPNLSDLLRDQMAAGRTEGDDWCDY